MLVRRALVFSASCNLRVASTDYCTPSLYIAPVQCSIASHFLPTLYCLHQVSHPHLGQLKRNNFSSHSRKRSCCRELFIASQLAAFKNGGLYCEGHPAELAGLPATLHTQLKCTREQRSRTTDRPEATLHRQLTPFRCLSGLNIPPHKLKQKANKQSGLKYSCTPFCTLNHAPRAAFANRSQEKQVGCL